MSVARTATLVSALGATVTVATTVAWLSVPDLPGIAAVVVAMVVAAIAWLVLLGATIRGQTRRRWIAVALLPAACALLFPSALLWQRVKGPWVEFLLRRRPMVRVAALGARGDNRAILANDLAAAGARLVEARPGYVSLQHSNSGRFSNYVFVHVANRRETPRMGRL